MTTIILTQYSGSILGPIARFLGWIMNWIYLFLSNVFGIENIGLTIIGLTILIYMCMLPMTIKQQKFSKISAVMNPEIQAIQAKYKGKSDQDSMMRMQTETKAVYEKYGTSPTGGCLQLLIQLPIIYALFRVINNIPAYVASVKTVFMNIVTPLMAENDFMDKISTFAEAHNMSIEKYDFTQSNYVIDLLYKFTDTEWGELITQFPDLTAVITENLERINNMNNFLGINLAEAPGFALTPALLIPILSGVTQWISTKLMTANQPINDNGEENTMASSMKMMNNFLPLMSAFFCITMPTHSKFYATK